MKFFFKQMLKSLAFYLEKRKSLSLKKIFFKPLHLVSKYAKRHPKDGVCVLIFSEDFVTRLEIIHLVDVSLRELEFQLSKGRRSLVAAEKKSYFRTLTGLFLYWVSLLLNVIKGHLKVHENASLMLLC